MSIRSAIRSFLNGLHESVQQLVEEAEQCGAEKAYQECLVQLCAELGVPGSPSFDEAVAYLRQREDNWAAVAKVAREVNVEMRAAEAVCIAAEESELEADLPWRIEDALVEWHMVKQKGAEPPAEERQQRSPADGGINSFAQSLVAEAERRGAKRMRQRAAFVCRKKAEECYRARQHLNNGNEEHKRIEALGAEDASEDCAELIEALTLDADGDVGTEETRGEQ